MGIIVAGIGVDPKKQRSVIETKDYKCTTICVDLNEKEKVIDVAKEMAEMGAQIIELCGGFGPIWMARVIEALGNSVPIGGVFYGPEARTKLIALGLAPENFTNE